MGSEFRQFGPACCVGGWGGEPRSVPSRLGACGLLNIQSLNESTHEKVASASDLSSRLRVND